MFTGLHNFRRVAADLEDTLTLGNLTDTARWVFATLDLAILCDDAGEPLSLSVYGSVESTSLFPPEAGIRPHIELRLWTIDDRVRAMRLFKGCESGTWRCFSQVPSINAMQATA